MNLLKRLAVAPFLFLSLAGLTPSQDADPLKASADDCFGPKKDDRTQFRACAIIVNTPAVTPEWRARAHLILGGHLQDANRYDEALRAHNAAVSLAPEMPAAYFGRARLYSELREREKAVEDFDTLIKLRPQVAQNWADRGNELDNIGRSEEAVRDLDEAIRLDPRPEFFRGRAIILAHLDRARAFADFATAIAGQSDFAGSYYGRGLVYYMEGDFAAAAQDYVKAESLGRHDAYVALWIFLSKARSGQDGTEDLLRIAKEIDLERWPGPIVQHILGLISEAELKPASNILPWVELGEECEARYYLSQLALLRGETEKAITLLRAAKATGIIEYREYWAAEAELARLGER